MGHHHDRRGRDRPNGRKILIHVIAGMNGQAYAGEHHNQRVAVGRGLGGGARTDNGARARAVLDDDLLAKGSREFLRNHSAHRVRTAPGRVWYDQRDRTRRIGLGAGRERPRCRCAAEQRDELASLHSITSSARESKLSEILTPSAFAVFKLITNWNLTVSITGRSAGLTPLSTRPV